MQTENLKPYGYIYKITNTINGKCYIGQSLNITRRFYKYRTLRCKGQPKLYNAFKKYGIELFSFEKLDTAPDQIVLDYLEDFYIQSLDTIKEGYNCRDGGCGGSNGPLTEEHKQKISNALKGKSIQPDILKNRLGKKRSPEAIQNIAECKRGSKNPNFGKSLSEETKIKLSESLRGRQYTEESKQKMSKIKQGDNNPMRKKKLSHS